MSESPKPVPTGEWRAYLQQNVAMGERDLYVVRSGVGFDRGARWYATGFTWVEVPAGQAPRTVGAMQLTTERREEVDDGMGSFLQAMLDCAWNAGMRPRGFKDHTNELAAVRYHLEDMRKLALK